MTNRSNQGRSGPHSPKQGRAATARPTRSQVKAMEARAATSAATADPAAPSIAPLNLDFGAIEVESAPPSRSALPRPLRRTVQRVIPITREQEYAYIRSDMQRLLTISGGLLVLMIVLLFVIER